jgi:hypothetical protein
MRILGVATFCLYSECKRLAPKAAINAAIKTLHAIVTAKAEAERRGYLFTGPRISGSFLSQSSIAR